MNTFHELEEKLDLVIKTNREVRELLENQSSPKLVEPTTVKPLTFKEACKYVDLSESYMRLLCHKKEVPYYKPRGRRLYFLATELDEWLKQGKSYSPAKDALNRSYL